MAQEPRTSGSSLTFIYAFLICYADMLILSLSILHPLSLVQIEVQRRWEVAQSCPVPRMCDSEERTLDLTVTMLCDLGQVTLSD